MPIDHWIDHERRFVYAKGRGVLLDEDVFEYQREVWSDARLVGYAELVDLSEIERIDLASIERVRELAELAAAMDKDAGQSKLAILAPRDFAFGLGRMYESYRELQGSGTKEVEVFRTLPEAMAFLGVAGGLPDQDSG